MNRRRAVVVASVSGAIFVLGASALAWQFTLSVQRAQAGDGARPVAVVTCASDISAGDRLTDLNITEAKVPKQLVPDGAVLSGDLAEAKGHRVTVDMGRGEILTEHRISSVSPLDRIRSGFTAVTVAADPVRALGGEATPGMKVDVMVEEAVGTVSTVATSVRILSASNGRGPTADESSLVSAGSSSGGDISWVTLEIPDPVVSAVVQASTSGSVYLVLPGYVVESSRG